MLGLQAYTTISAGLSSFLSTIFYKTHFFSTTHLSPNHILLCVLLFNPLDGGVFRNGRIHVVSLFPTQPDSGCII